MNRKAEYSAPEISVIVFAEDDVITTSIGSDNGFDGLVDDIW